ncbi:MAG: cyclic nucleotide-binding domain-containing protein [Herpetosiphonaceae bacterium]|nr:cyclic nucleotide-binding domain-containing protein [Herpetosiphonaceae bacterium]
MSSHQSGSHDEALLIQQLSRRFADVALFDHVAAEELEQLAARSTVEQVPPGVVLSAQQSTEHDLYIVIRGHLEVWLDPSTLGSAAPSHKLATLYADEFAGELALVDGGVRSARLQAGDDGVSVIRVPQSVILARCEENPQFGYQVMRNLAAILALRSRLTALSVQTLPL